MIVLVLILILTGSLAGATVLWFQDASIGMIALGYVGGGWAGLLLGLPVMLAVRAGVRALARWGGASPRSSRTRKPPCQDRNPAWAVSPEGPRPDRHRAPTPPGR